MKKYIGSIILLLLFFVATESSFAQGYLRHVVQWDETIYSIPVHYNTTTNDFLALNHMDVNVDLMPGTVVLVRKLKPGEVQEGENNKLADIQPTKLNKVDLMRDETRATVEAPQRIKNEPMRIAEPKPTAKIETPKVNITVDKGVDIGPNGIPYTISKDGWHMVEKKQTLFHLAVIYGKTIDELKQINNLTTTDISIGQKLKVSN